MKTTRLSKWALIYNHEYFNLLSTSMDELVANVRKIFKHNEWQEGQDDEVYTIHKYDIEYEFWHRSAVLTITRTKDGITIE